MANKINNIFDKIVTISIRDSIRSILLEGENEQEKRKQMERDLENRYSSNSKNNNSRKDEAESNTDKGINREKISPGISDDTDKRISKDASDNNTESKKKENTDKREVFMPTMEQFESPEFDLLASQINDMRSGTSLRDAETTNKFRKYYDILSEQDKRYFLVFATALSQLLRGGDEPDNVITPAKANINANASNTIKNIDNNKKEKIKSNNNRPDTASADSSMPIVVGEHIAIRRLMQQVQTRKRS